MTPLRDLGCYDFDEMCSIGAPDFGEVRRTSKIAQAKLIFDISNFCL